MILYFRISNFHWSRLLHAASRDLSSHVSVCDKKNLFVRGPIFVMLFSKLVWPISMKFGMMEVLRG